MEALIRGIRRKHKEFSRQEEAKLCRRMRKGDAEAREQLFFSVAPWAICLVRNMAKKLHTKAGIHTLFEDLVQQAMLGVLEAVERFDPKKGRLMTITYWYVGKQCKRYLLEDRMIRIPVCELGRCIKQGIASEKYPEVMLAGGGCRTVQGDCSLENQSIDRSMNLSDLREQLSHDQFLLQKIVEKMEALTERQRYVVEQRIMRGRTLKEIGNDLGVTRERVRQIEQIALSKISSELC